MTKKDVDSGFFVIIGWPAGRGEYDNLFANLQYFCEKINQWEFLFNYSSFIFGFSIPKKDFNPHFDKHYKTKTFKEILNEKFDVSETTTNNMQILLDVGGPRIFNKIVFDKLPLTDKGSYKKYLNAYHNFVSLNSPEIYVNFDIGPAYSSRHSVSINGRNSWTSLPIEQREQLNFELLEEAIAQKSFTSKLMVPINAIETSIFVKTLEKLHDNYRKDVDLIGIAGIANQNLRTINNVLGAFTEFKKESKWDIKSHGLGLGGWKKIPSLVHYNIESCDAMTPWRRACTDKNSNYYIPLIDANLDFTDYPDAMKLYELYDTRLKKVVCNCPFCKDLSLSELISKFSKSDKRNTGTKQHAPDYREMRVRTFFHNVFQHIALFRKLKHYKIEFGDDYLLKFIKEIPNRNAKQKIRHVLNPLIIETKLPW